MHYLIDGYNLLFFGDETKTSLKSRRQTIVGSLQKEFALLHLKGTVVFDGSHRADEQSGLSYKSPLVIAYSHQGQTADQYILEKLESANRPSEITIVTNDKGLAMHARDYGAKSMTIPDFFSHLKRKHSQKQGASHEKKPAAVSERELNRLLKIFEERMEEE